MIPAGGLQGQGQGVLPHLQLPLVDRSVIIAVRLISRHIDRTYWPGWIVRLEPGQFMVLHNFNVNTDGLSPLAAPIQGSDGNFYGTTAYGQFAKPGMVYKMTPSGKLTVLYTFSGSAGGLRYPVALILGTDGNFYGTTRGGGQPCNGGCGGIYKITPAGKLTVLHTFNGTDGEYPYGAIIQASDGNFYGTTLGGGRGVLVLFTR
jgi:uncharacterized repeat protein (TIGR03803 family)